jgi:hypothetical protein
MAMRIWLSFLGIGFGLTLLAPVVGVIVMLTGAVGLAIVLEEGLTPAVDLREVVDQPLHALQEAVAEVNHHGRTEKLQVAGDGGKFLLAGGTGGVA